MRHQSSLLTVLLTLAITLLSCFSQAGTVQAAPLTVFSPAGEDLWQPGEVRYIRWIVPPEINSIVLYYSTDGGINWTQINKYVQPNNGIYTWTVPNVDTNLARIKVRYWHGWPDTFHVAYSDVFTITTGWFGETRLLSPKGGERLTPGEVHNITWISTPPGGSITIEYSTDSGENWTRITRILNPGTGSYPWTVPDLETSNARVRIWRQVAIDPPLYKVDASGADFTISTGFIFAPLPFDPIPVIPLIYFPLAPSSLEALPVSENEINLSWTDNAVNEEGFKIERSTDGLSFNQIATVGADVTVYTDSGLPPATNYAYRVRAYNSSGASNYSNTATSVTLSPSVEDEVPGIDAAKTVEMRFYINSAEYYVKKSGAATSQLLSMDTAPIVREGRTLLPIRFIAEPLGAAVGWDAAQQKATVSLGANEVELWIGHNRARINGAYQYIDPANHNVVPIIVPPGRTMLPLRFIAETLGCQVDWNGVTQEVTVTYPAP